MKTKRKWSTKSKKEGSGLCESNVEYRRRLNIKDFLEDVMEGY